ncbi:MULTISPECIES: hypothetical protein [Actinomycetes]|uniref:hypothetical protein n=1 Tax=Actinomycetes TaxID=1760 RepID=UPI000AF7EC4C|nr:MULTISPECIES: hypothetical protein [Actinomycetes]
MPIEHGDVGCWVVKCNPVTGTDYFAAIAADDQAEEPVPNLYADSWCLSPRSGRSRMVRTGDLIAIWVTGPKNPGVYEVGWVVENRDDPVNTIGLNSIGAPEPRKVHYKGLRLGADNHVPRGLMQATAGLDRCEQLRAPMMSNPSYLTVEEARVLARLVADRVPDEAMTEARWDSLLS